MNIAFNAFELASLVRAFRVAEGLSLDQLATRAGVSKATLSRIENQNAKSGPDMISLTLVMSACNIDWKKVLTSDSEEGQAQIRDIDAQLRASGTISLETLQALEAIIRASRSATATD